MFYVDIEKTRIPTCFTAFATEGIRKKLWVDA